MAQEDHIFEFQFIGGALQLVKYDDDVDKLFGGLDEETSEDLQQLLGGYSDEEDGEEYEDEVIDEVDLGYNEDYLDGNDSSSSSSSDGESEDEDDSEKYYYNSDDDYVRRYSSEEDEESEEDESSGPKKKNTIGKTRQIVFTPKKLLGGMFDEL